MRVRQISAAALLLGLVCVAGGCASMQLPKASFKSMSVSDVTARGFVMNVDVDVENPHSFAIPLTNADYTLSLSGVKMVDGAKVKPAASVPANGRTTITLPVPLTSENLLTVEEAIRNGAGNVGYWINAGLSFDTGLPIIGVQRVPLQHEGTLNVKELLQRNWSIILTSPAAKELAQKVLGGLFKF